MYVDGYKQIFVIIIQQVLSSVPQTMQPSNPSDNIRRSQSGYRSPTHRNTTTTQSRNSLTSSQTGSSPSSNSTNQRFTIFDWATHVQFVVKTEQKRGCIKLLLTQNQNYFNKCIIYINSQNQANQLLVNLPQQFSNKAKVICNYKQASNYWNQLQKQQLKVLIIGLIPTQNQVLTNFYIPNCVDFIINYNSPPIKGDLEHRIRKIVGQKEQKLFKGVVINFCSSNYEKQQLGKFLASTKIIQMQKSTQNNYKFSEYFIQIQSKQKQQQLNRAQSSIQFDFKSAKQKQQQKQQQFDLSWATHIQIAVLENNKNEVTGKIIKNNYDNFNSFIVYAKDYNSAAVARESLPSKIKQKVALITNTLNLQQNFKKFINNETRILFMINDVAKRYLSLSTISIVNKADCIINMFPVSDAQQLRLKAGKKIKQMQKIHKGVVVNFMNTSVNQQKNTIQRRVIENINKNCNLDNHIIQIKNDQDYNLRKYSVIKQQTQKNVNINSNTNNQNSSFENKNQIPPYESYIQDKIEDESTIVNKSIRVESNINKQKLKTEQMQVQNNKVINCYNWATYLLVQCEQQFRTGRMFNFINKNSDSFDRYIVFVKNYARSKAILDKLQQNIKQKTSILSTSQSNLNEYLIKLMQRDLKGLILMNSQPKHTSFKIPSNVNFIIFDSLPTKLQQIEQKAAKITNGKDIYSNGVVVYLYHNETQITEFDKFVIKHNVIINKTFSAAQYSLLSYLKQQPAQKEIYNQSKQVSLQKQSYSNNCAPIEDDKKHQIDQVVKQLILNSPEKKQQHAEDNKVGVISAHSSSDQKKQNQKQQFENKIKNDEKLNINLDQQIIAQKQETVTSKIQQPQQHYQKKQQNSAQKQQSVINPNQPTQNDHPKQYQVVVKNAIIQEQKINNKLKQIQIQNQHVKTEQNKNQVLQQHQVEKRERAAVGVELAVGVGEDRQGRQGRQLGQGRQQIVPSDTEQINVNAGKQQHFDKSIDNTIANKQQQQQNQQKDQLKPNTEIIEVQKYQNKPSQIQANKIIDGSSQSINNQGNQKNDNPAQNTLQGQYYLKSQQQKQRVANQQPVSPINAVKNQQFNANAHQKQIEKRLQIDTVTQQHSKNLHLQHRNQQKLLKIISNQVFSVSTNINQKVQQTGQKLGQKIEQLAKQTQTVHKTIENLSSTISQPIITQYKQQTANIMTNIEMILKSNTEQYQQSLTETLTKNQQKQQQILSNIKTKLQKIQTNTDNRLKQSVKIDNIVQKQDDIISKIQKFKQNHQQQIQMFVGTVNVIQNNAISQQNMVSKEYKTGITNLENKIVQQYKLTIIDSRNQLKSVYDKLYTQAQQSHKAMTEKNQNGFRSIVWQGQKNKQKIIQQNNKIIQTISTQKQNTQKQLLSKKAQLNKQYEAQSQQQTIRLTQLKNTFTNKKQSQIQSKLKQQFNNFASKNKTYVEQITQLREQYKNMVADNKSVSQIRKKYIEEKSKNQTLESQVVKLRKCKENQTTQLNTMRNKLKSNEDTLKQVNRQLKLSQEGKNALGSELVIAKKCISDTKQQIMSLYQQRYKNPLISAYPNKQNKNIQINQQPQNILKTLSNLELLPLVKDYLISQMKTIDLQVLYISKMAKVDNLKDASTLIVQTAEYKDYAYTNNKQKIQSKNNSCSYLMTAINSLVTKHDNLKFYQIKLSKYYTGLQQSIKNLSEKTNKCVSEGAQCIYTKLFDHQNKESRLNPVLENISNNMNRLIAKIDKYFKQKQDLVAAVNRHQATIDNLSAKNKNLILEKQKLQLEKVQQISLNQQLQRNIKSAKQTISQLEQKQIKTTKQHEQAIRKLTNDYNILKKQKQSQSKSMLDTVTALKTDISRWTRDYNDLKTRSESTEAQQQRKYTTLKTNSQKSLQQQQSKYATLKNNSENKIEQLKQSYRNLQSTTKAQKQQLQRKKQQEVNKLQKQYQVQKQNLILNHNNEKELLKNYYTVETNKAKQTSQEFAAAISKTVQSTLKIKLQITPDNYKEKINVFAVQAAEKLSKSYFLPESEIYKKLTNEQKKYVYDAIKNLLPKKKIAYTKTLFEGYKDAIFDGWLYKIHKKQNLLMLMTLANGRQLCCFSQNPYSEHKVNKGGRGFMMSILNRRLYLLKSTHDGKAISYDEYMVKWGNNELLVKSDMKFSIIIGKQYLHFSTGTDQNMDFIGQVEDQGDYVFVEFHQVFFE